MNYDANAREAIRERAKLASDAMVGRMSVHGEKVKVSGDRVLSGLATTEDIDLDREVVVQEGCNPRHFLTNKRVFLDHDMGYHMAVGALRYVNEKHDRSGAIVKRSIGVRVIEGPLGDEILRIANEIGIGFSIGFLANDYGRPTDEEKAKYAQHGRVPLRIVRDWDWTETSFTCMPCNVSCQVDGAGKVDDTKASALSKMVGKKTIRRATAEMLGLPRPKAMVRAT